MFFSVAETKEELNLKIEQKNNDISKLEQEIKDFQNQHQELKLKSHHLVAWLNYTTPRSTIHLENLCQP